MTEEVLEEVQPILTVRSPPTRLSHFLSLSLTHLCAHSLAPCTSRWTLHPHDPSTVAPHASPRRSRAARTDDVSWTAQGLEERYAAGSK
jgi:hypothetical protein